MFWDIRSWMRRWSPIYSVIRVGGGFVFYLSVRFGRCYHRLTCVFLFWCMLVLMFVRLGHGYARGIFISIQTLSLSYFVSIWEQDGMMIFLVSTCFPRHLLSLVLLSTMYVFTYTAESRVSSYSTDSLAQGDNAGQAGRGHRGGTCFSSNNRPAPSPLGAEDVRSFVSELVREVVGR